MFDSDRRASENTTGTLGPLVSAKALSRSNGVREEHVRSRLWGMESISEETRRN
jgi:hypothetical protein